MKICSELCKLRGREKKFKSEQNRKIGLNEINYMQQLNFAKGDFFSCPAPLRWNPGFFFGCGFAALGSLRLILRVFPSHACLSIVDCIFVSVTVKIHF
jgi:hypothetical protein